MPHDCAQKASSQSKPAFPCKAEIAGDRQRDFGTWSRRLQTLRACGSLISRGLFLRLPILFFPALSRSDRALIGLFIRRPESDIFASSTAA